MSDNSDKTSAHPMWLNSEFFYSILRKNENFLGSTEFLCINSIHIEPAAVLGDNYMSSLFRILIEFSLDREKKDRQSLSLIAKVLPHQAAVEEFLEKYNAFPKEIKMYSEIIPGLEEIWQRAGHPEEFGPRCWYSSESPTVIIMDDLKAMGYGMIPRHDGLTLEETKTLMTKLAKFHAASVIYCDEKGPYNNLFNEGLVRMNVKDEQSLYYNSMYASLMEMMEQWDFAAPYLPKLRKWKDKIFETIYHLIAAESNSFNVLNHGDAWTNNLMFRHPNGVPEVLLVDYQLSFWTSPALDLIYLIFNACNCEDQLTHFDDLITFYHSKLKDSFEKLQKPEKTPTLEEINDAINRKGLFGAMFIVESIPLMKAVPDLKIDLDQIMDVNSEVGTATKRKIYSSEDLKKIYVKLLPFLFKREFLDTPE